MGPSYGLKGFQPAWDVKPTGGQPQLNHFPLLGLESRFLKTPDFYSLHPRSTSYDSVSGITKFVSFTFRGDLRHIFFDKTDWEINHRPQNKTGSNTKSWADVAG